MSTAATDKHASHDAHAAHGGHAHPEHLAHHFDTMGQQFDAGKLGMWVFLATEILMFGGLFCAYAVYRSNNPDVFAFAHKELNTTLGAINTVVLIASSLTMAWAVRCSQLGQSKALVALLALSLMGGFGFLSIKTIEYTKKWDHHLWLGTANEYHPKYTGEKHTDPHEPKGKEPGAAAPHAPKAPDAQHAPAAPAPATAAPAPAVPHEPPAAVVAQPPAPVATDQPIIDRSLHALPSAGPTGIDPGVLAGKAADHGASHTVHLADLATFDKNRVHIFFQVYYAMTGLHSFHVIVGMGLMFWLIRRAVRPAAKGWVTVLLFASIPAFFAYVGAIVNIWPLIYTGLVLAVLMGCWAIYLYDQSRRKGSEGKGEFGPHYFVPVDLVGLYWHLVDLIWIFLFPLLYLIH